MTRMHCSIFVLGFSMVIASAAITQAADASPAAPDLTDRLADVPIVPLPPAVYGSVASVGLMVALRYSKHRRWITLR